MTEQVFTCMVPWRIHPAVRVVRHFSPRAKRYHDDQKRLGDYMRVAGSGQVLSLYAGPPALRFGVAVFVQPTKTGPGKGLMPANIGDWDNYYKAALDCLVYRGWLQNDTARTVRGPGPVVLPRSWGADGPWDSGIYTWSELRPGALKEATVITIWRDK
jgi:hypothetical protein